MPLYLRFTSDPERDMERGHSLWLDPRWTDEDAQRMKEEGKAMAYCEEVGMWGKKHWGLSGHELDAKTVDEALSEIREGMWYKDPERASFAIFQGEDARPLHRGRDAAFVETRRCGTDPPLEKSTPFGKKRPPLGKNAPPLEKRAPGPGWGVFST